MADDKDDGKTTGKFPKATRTELGEVLVRANVVSIEQLDAARRQVAERGGTLAQRLAELGVTEDTLVSGMAASLGIPIVDLQQVPIPPEVLKAIPRQVAIRYGIIPISIDGGALTYATANPYDLYVMDDLKKMFGYKSADPVVTSESNIIRALKEFYAEDTLDDVIKNLTDEELKILEDAKDPDSAELEKLSVDKDIVRYVNLIFIQALRQGASDIHIEGSEDDFAIRFRIDGMMREVMRPPLSIHDAIISRIKIMSSLDIAEHRMPQSGRIKIKFGKKEVDLRIEICPYITGEKAVMRILDKSALQLDMTRLGFDAEQLKQFKQAVRQPWGMVLVTGPTGSGKTTTLYSALMELNQPHVKILTVEDPVEITVKGISQLQVKDDIGRNFSVALRSFLRQDPDIIMVGEIRDLETADIAIKAAMTGHLVLSTLHTNDAPSAMSRLLNMGIEPFIAASAVNLIAAQRLVRVICKNCKETLEVPLDMLTDLGLSEEEAKIAKLFRGAGCKHCNNSGYKGRLALFEVLPMSDEIHAGIMQGYTASELQKEAVRIGMQTLRQSGVKKLLDGITTIEEVLRVTKK